MSSSSAMFPLESGAMMNQSFNRVRPATDVRPGVQAMPGQVQLVQFRRRDLGWIDAEFGQNGVQVLAMQYVQPRERSSPASHLLHGRLVAGPPCIRESERIDRRPRLAPEERRGFASHSVSPIDDRSKHVEQQGSNSIQRHMSSTNRHRHAGARRWSTVNRPWSICCSARQELLLDHVAERNCCKVDAEFYG